LGRSNATPLRFVAYYERFSKQALRGQSPLGTKAFQGGYNWGICPLSAILPVTMQPVRATSRGRPYADICAQGGR